VYLLGKSWVDAQRVHFSKSASFDRAFFFFVSARGDHLFHTAEALLHVKKSIGRRKRKQNKKACPEMIPIRTSISSPNAAELKSAYPYAPSPDC
jgi:hypothetical protein